MSVDLSELDRALGMLSNLAARSPEMRRKVESGVRRALEPPAGDTASRREEAVARATLAVHQGRDDLPGSELFRDPAWDMLLDLYVTRGRGRDTSVTSLCAAANVPTTTGLRYIAAMERHGLVRRRRDATDHRRTLVDPDPKVMERMTGILRRFVDMIGG